MKYIAQGSVILIFRLTGLSHTVLSWPTIDERKKKNISISFAPMYSVTRKVIHYYFMKL